MNQTELTDFGTRSAATWSSQHPDNLCRSITRTARPPHQRLLEPNGQMAQMLELLRALG